MIGVVLCGGQSTRMGTDKGLLQHHSTSWAQLAVDKLKQLELAVVLSVNLQQNDIYKDLFQNLMVIPDAETLHIGGPLKGILTVHEQHRDADLLVLACDMRDMQQIVLNDLYKTFIHTSAEAIVFRNGSHIEPLCGIYSTTGLRKVYDLYAHGLLKKFSMHYVLQRIDTMYLPVTENWENCFKNFNTAADLDLL